MAKVAKRKRTMNSNERRRAQAAAAMPQVKRLVRRFGRVAVANCVNRLAAWERENNKLTKMKREVAALETRLRV